MTPVRARFWKAELAENGVFVVIVGKFIRCDLAIVHRLPLLCENRHSPLLSLVFEDVFHVENGLHHERAVLAVRECVHEQRDRVGLVRSADRVELAARTIVEQPRAIEPSLERLDQRADVRPNGTVELTALGKQGLLLGAEFGKQVLLVKEAKRR